MIPFYLFHTWNQILLYSYNQVSNTVYMLWLNSTIIIPLTYVLYTLDRNVSKRVGFIFRTNLYYTSEIIFFQKIVKKITFNELSYGKPDIETCNMKRPLYNCLIKSFQSWKIWTRKYVNTPVEIVVYMSRTKETLLLFV